MTETSNLLVVICDINSGWWSKHNTTNNLSGSFQHCMESLLVFCNSYLMLNHTNRLAFIACHTHSVTFLYPNEALENQYGDASTTDGKFEVFAGMNAIIIGELKKLIDTNVLNMNLPTLLSGALTKALCYIHGQEKDDLGQKINSRIFIFKGSPDISTQYMSTMNCIFAAQKKNVPIDSCTIGKNSGFLQQASDISNGTYFNVENLAGILGYLIWIFLPESEFRNNLQVPSMCQIDYRAACFCHKQLVDVGFVCSVCLSIYCQFMPKCLTCQTRFKPPQLPISKPKKKKKEEAIV